MQFTGMNLIMVRRGIDYALSDIHNQIASCPDVELYAADLDELEQEHADFTRLLARIDAAIDKESAKDG